MSGATEADWIGTMAQAALKLPDQWEQDFWLGCAQQLAELVAECRPILTAEQLALIVGAGAIMLRQATEEMEAAGMVDAMFQRLRDGRAQ